MASTYYDDNVDFESFSFDQDPMSPVWDHSNYDNNHMSGQIDTFWQNLGLHADQQHQPLQQNTQFQHASHQQLTQQQHTLHQQQFNVQNTDAVAYNFANHQQYQHHQHQHQQPQVHNDWSNTANMTYIKQELESQHNQGQHQYNYYSSGSSQNSYDSSFSASTDSDADFEDSQQSSSWEPQQHQQHQHIQQDYAYTAEHYHAMHSQQTHPEHMYIKPELKHDTNAYSPDSQEPEDYHDYQWTPEEESGAFMADDENDPGDFKLPASKTPIMEAMVVCAINNWGISVIKSTPGEVVFKVLDFDKYYRISRSICSKHRPTEDIGSRVKSLRRWFTNFPKKKDRQENPQFFLSVKPSTCKKVHGLIERNTKLLNAQRRAR